MKKWPLFASNNLCEIEKSTCKCKWNRVSHCNYMMIVCRVFRVRSRHTGPLSRWRPRRGPRAAASRGPRPRRTPASPWRRGRGRRRGGARRPPAPPPRCTARTWRTWPRWSASWPWSQSGSEVTSDAIIYMYARNHIAR